MYFDYLEETGYKQYLKWGFGFAIYHIETDSLYVDHVYIKPKFRKGDIFATITKRLWLVAKKNGLQKCFILVRLQHPRFSELIKLYSKLGFEYYTSAPEGVVMILRRNAWVEKLKKL